MLKILLVIQHGKQEQGKFSSRSSWKGYSLMKGLKLAHLKKQASF